ncbi:sodium- and chloride-dependent glycine transporter 1 isoform X1 [Octopus bimaculoides]|nr:sodium- and chloride-dependent glycine transporter 1 isoform X1 [Octopus bimaculoides]
MEVYKLHAEQKPTNGICQGAEITEAPSSGGKTPKQRGTWGKQIEFFITCVGFAVGLGNVWRFPYLCYKNGGGAFLIPYFICLITIGIPLFFMEISVGQFSGLGPLTIFRHCPPFKGVGYSMLILVFLIIIYYNVIVAYSIYFLFASFTSSLPWLKCNNKWNTCNCTVNIYGDKFTNIAATDPSNQVPSLSDIEGLFNETRPECRPNLTDLITFSGNVTPSWKAIIDPYFYNYTSKTASEEYFFNQVLKMTDNIYEMVTVEWDLSLCLLLAWCIVFFVLVKGIKSLGKVAYFTSLFPYILLACLLGKGATLEGSSDGIYYYLRPDVSKLKNVQVWVDAAVQIFFSVSTSMGGLITMASYNKFHNNTFRDSILLPFINCLTSFLAGFAIFSVLGFMSYKKGVPLDKVVEDGPGLAFVVYPECLGKMPLASLWSALFFIMMWSLGASSLFSLSENIFTSITDEYAKTLLKFKNSMIFRVTIVLLCFVCGLIMVTKSGLYWLNLIDNSVVGLPLIIIGFFEIISFQWIYGNVSNDITLMLGKKTFMVMNFCCKFITPIIMFLLILFKFVKFQPIKMGSYEYPMSAQVIGYLLSALCVIFIPGYLIYYLLRNCSVSWDFF